MTFSCRDCVAPKRHPGCHGSCQAYMAEKAEYNRQKAIVDQRKEVEGGLLAQKLYGVNRAFKDQRRMKGK